MKDMRFKTIVLNFWCKNSTCYAVALFKVTYESAFFAALLIEDTEQLEDKQLSKELLQAFKRF